MATTTTASNTCSVTNSVTLPTPASTALAPQTGWNGSIICINGYNPTTTGTAQGYEQTLQQLPFASGNTLAIGETSTVTLDQTLNGQAVTLYDLIFAQADNLFPVQSSGVMQNFKTLAYPPITVSTSTPSTSSTSSSTSSTSASTTAATTALPNPTVNAWLFYQNINAYPTSNMAQQFATVGNDTTANATSTSDVTSSVNSFFQATDDYTNVTLESYTLVTSYLAAYAFAWANFESSYTYYITATTSSGATSAGTVTFTQAAANANGFPPLTDTNGSGNSNYTITYTDAQGATTPLYFSSGQLVSDMNEEVLSICLQCNYASLSTFSNLPTDWATIVPTLCGTAFSQTVVGVNWQVPKTQEDWQQKTQQALNNFFNSNGVHDFMEITGLLMGLKLCWDGVVYLKEKFAKTEAEDAEDTEKEDGDAATKEELEEDEDPTSEESDTDREEVTNDQTKAVDDQQEIADRLGTDGDGNPLVTVVNPSDVPDTQQTMASAKADQDNQEDTDLEEDELVVEGDELEDESGLGVDSDMKVEAEDEEEEYDDLQEGDDTSADLKTDQSGINTDQQETSETYQDDEGEVSAQTKAEVSDDEEETTEAETDEEDDEEDESDDEKDGDDMKDDDDLDDLADV